MANKDHLRILKQGIGAWNQWRLKNLEIEREIEPDLSRADLYNTCLYDADLSQTNLREATLELSGFWNANLSSADLSDANLRGADLLNANLSNANLTKADLSNTKLFGADVSGANLSKANLSGANLSGANLSQANLSGANIRDAQLVNSHMVATDLLGANLSGSTIYGIAAWDLKVDDKTEQLRLVVTPEGGPQITVDDIELAQFIYFLITNRNIRNIINTVAKKAVLILGRFTSERKEILVAIADSLRTMDLVPIIFDFKKSEEQDIIETVTTLAGISKFVIVDITDARVIPDELRSFIPDFAVPVVPLFRPSKKEPKPYASLNALRKYDWVFEPVEYKSKEQLISMLPEKVVKPAEAKRAKLRDIK
jgi:hypothetical protein